MDWKFIPLLGMYLLLLYVVIKYVGLELFFEDPINTVGFIIFTVFLLVYIVIENSGEIEEEEENDSE